MSPGPDLSFVIPNGLLYRIGRKPDPWRAPDWALSDPETRTFGNRFDDAQGYFRVLYASSTRLGCFLETLSRFRTSPAARQVAADLTEISHTKEDHLVPSGLPVSWLTGRCMGRGLLRTGRYATIYSSGWLAHLRQYLEPELVASGLITGRNADFDIQLLMSQNRHLTQRAATLIASLGYAGICYESRHGTNLVNWALFEPFKLEETQASDLVIEDPDFLKALESLDLLLVSTA